MQEATKTQATEREGTMTLQLDDEQPVLIRYRDRDGEKEYEGGLGQFFLEHPGRCLETLTLFFEKPTAIGLGLVN